MLIKSTGLVYGSHHPVCKIKSYFLNSSRCRIFSCNYGINGLNRIIELYPISDIAVYGSFLFHYLSGYSFVDHDSDLDLLINYCGHSLADLYESVSVLTKKFNRTIDGEVRFPDFGDIPIKELLDLSAKKLLCKSKDKVTLLSRTELYEYYPLL